MTSQTDEVSVRARAARLRVAVAVVVHGKAVRWWAVSENGCEAMAAGRPLIDRRGDVASTRAGWEAVARALDETFGRKNNPPFGG